MKLVAIVLAGAVASACAYLGSETPQVTESAQVSDQSSPAPTQAQPTVAATISVSVGPSASASPSGCEAAAIAPFAPPWKGPPGFGGTADIPILGIASVTSAGGASAALPGLLLPRVVPTDLTVQTILLVNDPTKVDVEAFYTAKPITQDDGWDGLFVASRVIVVEEQPTSGNTAAAIKKVWGDQALILRVGNYDAALIASQGHPEYLLLWSDGTLDFYGHASLSVSPSELVDSARSPYCP
jgi:hypothetical protein